MGICRTLLGTGPGPADEPPLTVDGLTDAMHVVAREARTIEQRVSRFDWIVGDDYSAIDMVIFPAIQLLAAPFQGPNMRGLICSFVNW